MLVQEYLSTGQCQTVPRSTAHTSPLMPSSPSLSEALPELPPGSNETLQSPSAAHHLEDHPEHEAEPTWKGPAPWWLMALTSFNRIIWGLTFMARLRLYSQLLQVHGTGGVIQNTRPFFEPYLAEKNAHLIHSSRDNPVQAFMVIDLLTISFLVTEILTLLTLAWWGSFSDRHGRKRMLGIASLAQLLSCLMVLIIANYIQVLPGAYWFLIFDIIILGALGGTESEFVTVLAYLSDVSMAEKRSRLFTVVLGMVWAGSSIGVKLGDFVLRKTSSLLWVFYTAAALRIIHACLVWFILPESLTREQMHRTTVAHQETHLSTTDEPLPLLWFKRLFFFLKPLSMLFPEKVSPANSPVRRDWSLTILVAASATMVLVSSPLAVFQWFYALHKFGWEKLSNYIPLISNARIISLVLILPLAFKFAQKRWTRSDLIRAQTSEREPLLSTAPDVSITSLFDLGVARLSVLVIIATYLILPLAPTETIFTLFSVLQTLGAGFYPVTNSLAFELYTGGIKRNGLVESGKFFATLHLVFIVVPILGELTYDFIYSATSNTYPGAVFFVGFGNTVIVFVLLVFVGMKPAPRRGSLA
ncbi:major facilitator superfamily domain-containing protein [Mycena metata]|uniref:Major facilitator superfamily domain-containing protein n=1 Tax=Mycena metata TaxID=1033252 RepID=A0AAD7GYJ8_9AGAR|nr:major facilitator superfamily domain-containing protein [Mycena metata]